MKVVFTPHTYVPAYIVGCKVAEDRADAGIGEWPRPMRRGAVPEGSERKRPN